LPTSSTRHLKPRRTKKRQRLLSLQIKKFLATLEKDCKDAEIAYQERLKTRTEEIQALSETLKILTDDAARERYDKTISLLQLDASQTSSARALLAPWST